ncbi:hypothetical protein ANANG_G00259300, partial [Anguilla anguilla]
MGTSRASVFYSFLTFFTVLFRNASVETPVDCNSTILESTSSEVSTASVNTTGEGNWTEVIDPETWLELVQNVIPAAEGDLVQKLDRNAVGSAWTGKQPGFVSVPYRISDNLAHREKDIMAAFEEISENTCVSFHAHTSEADYLLFTKGYGCASYLGRTGGEQPIYIGDRCKTGNIVHEIMHALGFHHEHMRKDRDDHVTVVYSNIIPHRVRNFAKIRGDTQGLPYDTESIMHYGQRFFSVNGKATIISKDTKAIGQRIQLSVLDILRVQLLYKCGNTSQTTTAPVNAQTTTASVNAQTTTASLKTQ